MILHCTGLATSNIYVLKKKIEEEERNKLTTYRKKGNEEEERDKRKTREQLCFEVRRVV